MSLQNNEFKGQAKKRNTLGRIEGALDHLQLDVENETRAVDHLAHISKYALVLGMIVVVASAGAAIAVVQSRSVASNSKELTDSQGNILATQNYEADIHFMEFNSQPFEYLHSIQAVTFAATTKEGLIGAFTMKPTLIYRTIEGQQSTRFCDGTSCLVLTAEKPYAIYESEAICGDKPCDVDLQETTDSEGKRRLWGGGPVRAASSWWSSVSSSSCSKYQNAPSCSAFGATQVSVQWEGTSCNCDFGRWWNCGSGRYIHQRRCRDGSSYFNVDGGTCWKKGSCSA